MLVLYYNTILKMECIFIEGMSKAVILGVKWSQKIIFKLWAIIWDVANSSQTDGWRCCWCKLSVIILEGCSTCPQKDYYFCVIKCWKLLFIDNNDVHGPGMVAPRKNRLARPAQPREKQALPRPAKFSKSAGRSGAKLTADWYPFSLCPQMIP